jgi:hypothetical protein
VSERVKKCFEKEKHVAAGKKGKFRWQGFLVSDYTAGVENDD